MGYSQPSGSTPADPQSELELQENTDLLIEAFLPQEAHPPPYSEGQPQPISRPFCLPQTSSGYDAPFARGYNPELPLSQNEMLSFLDGLNLAIVASPPLRVVDLAGGILGFVPYHWAQVASIVLQTAAGVAMRVVSKSLTDRYLREANMRLFKPRGLLARLYTTNALSYLLSGTAKPKSGGKQKLEAVGRGVGKVLLRLPLTVLPMAVRAIADKPPNIQVSSSVGPVENIVVLRRLALVEGSALPVNLDVPPPRAPEGVGEKVQSVGLKFDRWKTVRRQTGVEKKRVNLELERQGISRPGWRGVADTVARTHRQQDTASGLEGLLGVKLRETKLERDVANADLLEHWNTRNALWIVIMPAIGEHVQDIEIADTAEDEEVVSEQVWSDELNREAQMDSSVHVPT